MKTVEGAIFTRLNSDTTLQTLLGGAGRIYHALEMQGAQKPSITYILVNAVPGKVNSENARTIVETYMFIVFADGYQDIVARVRRLLDGYRFPATADAGNIKAEFDSEGPDQYDEALSSGRKDFRYRIYVVPKALASI